jgi:hypothetical protein
MAYATFPAAQAPRQPARPEVPGYLFNTGGLSNQKMALAGLFLAALAQRSALNLPYMLIKDHHAEDERLARFEEVFDLAALRFFARRFRVGVEATLPAGEPGGWGFFTAFGDLLTRRDQANPIRAALLALTALRPRMVATATFRQFCTRLFDEAGVRTVVQLRIEQDWQAHVDGLLPDGAREDIGIGFEEILRRTVNTFPDLTLAYVTADESSLPVPKEQIREWARQRHGLRLVWKSDLLDVAAFTPLDLSIIDFEIARRAERFVGVSYSSFANLLCLEQFAAARRPVGNHFIYNHPGDQLRPRRDNGFAIASAEVVLPHWSDRLWLPDAAPPPPSGERAS